MFCPKCGGQNPDNSRFCSYCGNEITVAPQPQYSQPQQSTYNPQPQYQQPAQYTHQTPPVEVVKGNMPLGILGALIGGLLGALSILLFFQIDRVAALSGVILAFCTLKGYELLGKKLSTPGIVICVIIMLIMPFVAYIVHSAILVTKEVDVSFSVAFNACVTAIKEGYVSFGDIASDLALVYLFAALGGVGTTIAVIKSSK